MMVPRQPSDSPCRFPSFVCLCWIFPSASSFGLFPRVLSSTFTCLQLGPDHFSHSGVLATVHSLVTSNFVPPPPVCRGVGRTLGQRCRFRKEEDEFSLCLGSTELFLDPQLGHSSRLPTGLPSPTILSPSPPLSDSWPALRKCPP